MAGQVQGLTVQVSSKLRRATDGYFHWCPGCLEVHCIFDRWTFDGNLESPTFNPSVHITGKQKVVDDKGNWVGEWRRGPDGQALDHCCHYHLHAGVLKFCGDCTHPLNGLTVPLPDLPTWLRDP